MRGGGKMRKRETRKSKYEIREDGKPVRKKLVGKMEPKNKAAGALR
jgi:hypothetical protein